MFKNWKWDSCPTGRVRLLRREVTVSKRFLSRTVVSYSTNWPNEQLHSFTLPFCTSLTLYPVFLCQTLIYLSTYWTHDVRHDDTSFADDISYYYCPFTLYVRRLKLSTLQQEHLLHNWLLEWINKFSKSVLTNVTRSGTGCCSVAIHRAVFTCEFWLQHEKIKKNSTEKVSDKYL